MKILYVVICVIGLVFSPVTAKAASVTITAAASSEVTGEIVHLGEIAEISSDDAQEADALSNLVVGRIVLPGNVIGISPQVLKLRIQAAGIDSSDFAWNLPVRIEVHRAAQALTGGTIEQAGQQAINDQLKKMNESRKYTIESITVPRDLNLPQGTVSYETNIPGGVKPALPTSVEVSVLIDGKPYKKVIYRARIHIYQDVLTAARAINRGERITESDLTVVSKEVNAYSGACLTDSKMAVGFVMARSVSAGTILLKAMVDKPIVVERGFPLHLIVNVNGISVQMEGTALESGRVGDRIRVRNESSRKILYGKVLDNTAVEIAD